MAKANGLERGDVIGGGAAVVLYQLGHFANDTNVLIYDLEEGFAESHWGDDLDGEEIVEKNGVNRVAWEDEAAALSEYTLLTDRESQWYALNQRGYARREIAEVLGNRPNTVDNIARSARQRIDRAAATAGIDPRS